jgi:IS30 family transposase
MVSPLWRHAAAELGRATRRFLSYFEREELAVLKAQGLGVRAIARELQRDAGAISRELRRNAATRSGKAEYRATVAQWKASWLMRMLASSGRSTTSRRLI